MNQTVLAHMVKWQTLMAPMKSYTVAVSEDPHSGYVRGTVYGSPTWDDEHDAAIGVGFLSGGEAYTTAAWLDFGGGSQGYCIWRLVLRFNPATLPPIAQAAKLQLYLNAKQIDRGDVAGLHIVSGIDLAPRYLVLADYGALLDKVTPFASLPGSSLTQGAYNDFVLNQDGVDEINSYLAAGENIRLGARPYLDLEDIPCIDNVKEWKYEWNFVKSPNPPRLVITA